MSLPIPVIDSDILNSIVEHVFMPPKLPQEAPTETHERNTNEALCDLLIETAEDFHQCLSHSKQWTWANMRKMMKLIRQNVKTALEATDLQSMLSALTIGGEFHYLRVVHV
jgi:hypothetical protein